MISEKCVELLNALAGKDWSEVFKEGLAEYFEYPIRKFAHFCEYAVMGVLVFFIWYPWLGFDGTVKREGTLAKSMGKIFKKLPKVVKIAVPWVFVSAAFDEFHQLFIPGRCGTFWDVLLDTTGGCFGLVCCILGVKLAERRVLKKERRKQKNRI